MDTKCNIDQGEELPRDGLEVAGLVECIEVPASDGSVYKQCNPTRATGKILFVDTTIEIKDIIGVMPGHCKYSLKDSFDSIDTWAWYGIEFVKLAFCFKALLGAYRYALPHLG